MTRTQRGAGRYEPPWMRSTGWSACCPDSALVLVRSNRPAPRHGSSLRKEQEILRKLAVICALGAGWVAAPVSANEKEEAGEFVW